MIDLALTAFDNLMESTIEITSGISTNAYVIGNAALCADSIYTTSRAGINFYCSPNPISKVFFSPSCTCRIVGATPSGTALVTSFAGIHPWQDGLIRSVPELSTVLVNIHCRNDVLI